MSGCNVSRGEAVSVIQVASVVKADGFGFVQARMGFLVFGIRGQGPAAANETAPYQPLMEGRTMAHHWPRGIAINRSNRPVAKPR